MAPPNILVVTPSADRFPDDPSHRTGVWLEEFTVPYLELRGRQAGLTVVSSLGGDVPVDPRSAATAAHTRDWAEPIAALSGVGRLVETRAADFDAVFLPGGHGPMFDLPADDASCCSRSSSATGRSSPLCVTGRPASFAHAAQMVSRLSQVGA